MKRRRFTYRDILSIVARQLGVCGHGAMMYVPHVECPLCGEPLDFNDMKIAELDHIDALGFGEGRDEIHNLAFTHQSCHKRKTAEDKRRMAKADRQGGKTGQRARRERNGPTLQSRPMQKPADVGRRYDWKAGRMEDV